MSIRYFKGVSMSEYGIAVALLAVACIAALTAFGSGINSVLGFFNQQLSSSPGPVVTAPSSQSEKQTALPIEKLATEQEQKNIAMNQPPPDSAQVNFDFSSIGNVGNLVDTTGANGATEVMASSISQYANQLLAEGKITQDQASILQDLANQGHTLAGAQKALEDAYTNGTNVTYNGQAYAITDFAQQVGGDEYPYRDLASMKNDAQFGRPIGDLGQMQPFINTYNKALTSLDNMDPNIAANVKTLTSNIVFLHSQVTAVTRDGTAGDNPAFATSEGRQNWLKSLVSSNSDSHLLPPGLTVSGYTNAGSTVICNSGNGSDNGSKCR